MDESFASFYQDRTVLLTGHTGFKGGWLATWLKLLGARLIGFAQPARTDQPSLFQVAGVADNMVSIIGDIRNLAEIQSACQTYAPEVIFHLAAQPLVRRSYRDPLETLQTNIMGTAHILEVARHTPSIRVVVIVTSDKCYENREWVYAYRENDPMGGHDPYSASKGAAELVTASYRNSFFQPQRFADHRVSLASVRAGNVIGGGDWSADRIIPDCVKALAHNQAIQIRSPGAVRPWQLVLEPLAGYLWLATRMWHNPRYGQAWNFGPNATGNITVRYLVERVLQEWGDGEWADISGDQGQAPHEDTYLKLDCTKAANVLLWRPILTIDQAVSSAVAWYRNYYTDPNFDGYAFTIGQIEAYSQLARQAGLSWAATKKDI
jgi:CDP-glucose 4,6-dehydratase